MLKHKNKTIARNVRTRKSIQGKALGLMFSRKEDMKNSCLIFDFKEEQVIPLHMIFVFYAIDVIYTNKDKKIVEIKRKFKPFTFYTPKKKAKYVIELAKNASKNLKVGDKLEW